MILTGIGGGSGVRDDLRSRNSEADAQSCCHLLYRDPSACIGLASSCTTLVSYVKTRFVTGLRCSQSGPQGPLPRILASQGSHLLSMLRSKTLGSMLRKLKLKIKAVSPRDLGKPVLAPPVVYLLWLMRWWGYGVGERAEP